MKRSLILCLIALAALCTYAQNNEATYNYIRKSITRNADGTTDQRVSLSLTLHTHTAMNSTYGETFIIYNPDFQTLTIDTAYTIRKNGTRIPLPENALVEVLPSWAVNAADFNNIKEMVVIHTGLDLGCTIYLSYTIHSVAGYNKNFDFNEEIDQSSPVTEIEYNISVPSSGNLVYALYSPNGEVAPTQQTNKDGALSITYKIKNIPAQSRDRYTTTDLTKQWRLFTTTSNFQSEMAEIMRTAKDADVLLWGKDVVKNEPDARKRQSNVRQFASEHFATVQIPFTLANGLRPYKQLKSCAYITPYERAAIYSSMLNASNIRASIAVGFNPSLPDAFRTMNNVAEFLVAEQFGETLHIFNPANNAPANSKNIIISPDTIIIPQQNVVPSNRTTTLSAKVEDLNEKGYLLLSMKGSPGGISGWGWQALPTIRYSQLEIPNPIDETEVFNITTEQGVKLSGRYGTNISSQCGAKLEESLTQISDDSIIVKRHIVLPKKVYSVDEYADIRRIINAWINPNHAQLLFIKK